jgi:hydroxyacylglutathione hydrolase
VDEVAAVRAKGGSTIPSTIGLEKESNPFLRCDQPEAIASARRHAPDALTAPAVFAALREWKNRF